MRVANGTVYWTPFIGTVTTKCMGQERWSSRKEVPMTRIDQLRSRVRGQLSSTVLKTNAKSDLDRVEFIEITYQPKGAFMTIRKRLTSTAMFHTPGLFRALQNDYRIKGKTRQRAVQILSDGYGLPVEEARGLLSGSIPVEINEAAGTVTYEVSDAAPALLSLSNPQS